MMMYGIMEVELHALLTLTLGMNEFHDLATSSREETASNAH
jgi:hypothetical protein